VYFDLLETPQEELLEVAKEPPRRDAEGLQRVCSLRSHELGLRQPLGEAQDTDMSERNPSSRSNRRRVRRLRPNGKVEVVCHPVAAASGPNLALCALDLSQSGVRLVLEQALPEGEEVQLVLTVPGFRNPVSCRGRVAWCLPLALGAVHVGVQFAQPLSYAELQGFTR
jgi:hypothetical protein